jgi:hypothetical protein
VPEIDRNLKHVFQCAEIMPKNGRTGLSETGGESQSLIRGINPFRLSNGS